MMIHLATAPPGAFPADLASCHRHDLRVVYVQADPGDRSPGVAAMTVLESLGKNSEVAGGKDGAHDNVAWLPLWLRAHEVEWLVLADPQVYRPDLLGHLLRVVLGTPTNALVAARNPAPAETVEVLHGFAPAPVAWDDIPAMLPAGANTSPAPPGRITPPSSDWHTYRADCRALLPADQHAVLDRHYLDTLAATRAWLARETPTEASTQAFLAREVTQVSNVAEGLTRVRAAQAGFFSHRWHLRISTAHLMKALAAAVDAQFTDADWMALRAYRPPYRPALVALHEAGIPEIALMEITVDEAATAIDSNRLDGHRLSPHAKPFLTAQLLQRATEHARPRDPFVVGAARTPGDVINRAARDLGLLIGIHHAPTNPHTRHFWQFRTGLSLQPL